MEGRITREEALAILNRWDRRQPGERDLVLEADRILRDAWAKRVDEVRRARARKL